MQCNHRYSVTTCAFVLVALLASCPGVSNDNPDITPPSEVRNLLAQSGDGSVRFAWEDPNEADLEFVEIQLVPGGGQYTVVMPDIGTAVLANLTNGTAYQFRIQTVDTSGNRSFGVTIFKTPGIAEATDTTPPDNVSNLQAVPGDRQVALAWTSPTDIDCNGIVILHDRTTDDSAVEVSRSRTSIVYAGLENGTQYEFTLYAED
ncbi:MAG: fibronectin type III domain-containing protein, partial [Spirochaetota bacterium]